MSTATVRRAPRQSRHAPLCHRHVATRGAGVRDGGTSRSSRPQRRNRAAPRGQQMIFGSHKARRYHILKNKGRLPAIRWLQDCVAYRCQGGDGCFSRSSRSASSSSQLTRPASMIWAAWSTPRASRRAETASSRRIGSSSPAISPADLPEHLSTPRPYASILLVYFDEYRLP
jgi:hypothetical protein